MPNSYEHSYQHDLDNVIDASDAVLAIGTEKVDTTTLKDRALSNDATIHGAMPSNGYFLGRGFNANNMNYITKLNADLNSYSHSNGTVAVIFLTKECLTDYTDILVINNSKIEIRYRNTLTKELQIRWVGSSGMPLFNEYTEQYNVPLNKITTVLFTWNDSQYKLILNGTLVESENFSPSVLTGDNDIYLASSAPSSNNFSGNIYYTYISDSEYVSTAVFESFFNTIARLPIYSHNFERYPNSDTSLTSVFSYTSGIITSGSFNKTDGLKCTSAGTIIFSNSFEFDGSEYITLIIDDVEYSGTTTVTQGTIIATIAQGSNDITIDMGTNDVLEDIQIQFRSEV